MSRQIAIFILILFNVFTLASQNIDIDFPAMRWTVQDGLKSRHVADIAADSRGVIWVATVEGLYRHHANNFENINTILKSSPFDNPIEIYELYIDKQDRLWIGTIENGLIMYDIKKNTIKQYDALLNGKDRLSDLRIYGLHTLNDSIFRFTSHTHGIIDYNLNQDKFDLQVVFTDSLQLEKYDGFQLMIQPLLSEKSTIVKGWYHSLSGMIKYDTELDSFLYYRNEDEIRIRKAIMDKDSIAWCVTYGQGLFSFDLKTKQFENYRCTDGEDWSHGCLSGGSIEIYNDSTLIFDSSDRLYYFNKKDKTFIRFTDILPNSDWSGITPNMKWINDELWQASWSSTLYRHYKNDHGVKSVSVLKNIQDVFFDKRNKRYISVSQADLITIYKDNEYKEIRVPSPFRNGYSVQSVTIDLKGNFWIASSDNILLYDENRNTYSSPFEDILAPVKNDLTFKKIAVHPNGSIWLSSHDGTIFTFDPETMQHQFYGASSEESEPLDYQYRARLEQFSNDGYVWFSSQDGFFGISPADQNHKFCKNLIDRATDLPITQISPSIAVGNDGKICFGAQVHELFIVDIDSLNGGYADLIDLKDIAANVSINDIEIDINGVIWIATKMGLIQIDRNNNIIELYGDTHRLYDLDELEMQEGIYPIAISHNDFLVVNPDELSPFPGNANIQLLSTELDSRIIINEDGTSLMTGQKIKLGSNDNYLRIQFNDFNYVSRQPKTYAIKVEGLHDDWIDLNERNEFGFSGLSGGLSKIMVKSKLQFAKTYSEPVNLLSIDVTPPLTQRKAFWAFCAGLLMLLFYLGYRYRLSQLKEKQNLMIAFNKQLAETEMKALRAQMNPHFLFNVLNAIKLNVQKNEQENAIDFITDFSKLIRSVLQNSGKKRISLKEELHTLELYIKIERKRFSTSFDYEFTVDENINTEDITIPPMLLQPYVENAIWHGVLHKSEGNGEIKVKTYKSGDDIVVEINDNGIGREKANQLKLKSAQKNKSMGMQITKDRMTMSNIISSDHIEVNIIDLYNNDRQSTGTKVVITIKLK